MSPEQITIVIAVIINLVAVYLAYYKSYRKIKGENEALLEDLKKMNYEGEKGKNLATKEDIGEITKNVENIKTELLHISQAKLILANKHYEIFN